MTESNNTLSKVITSETAGKQYGGTLGTDQARQFIEYMWDERVLMQQARTEVMTGDIQELDRLNIGRRLLRGASEAVDDGVNFGARWGKISLTSVKLRADWEISRESIEDGLYGDDLEDMIARRIAKQIGQDLEDLAVNGDIADAGPDPLLFNLDGWGKLGRNTGNVVQHAGGEISPALLRDMVKAMPMKYKRAQGMKFFAHTDLVMNYAAVVGDAALAAAATNSAAELRQETARNFDQPGSSAGWTVPAVAGLFLQEVPLMGEYEHAADESAGTVDAKDGVSSDVWLTYPKNLVWGTRRAIEVFSEFKPKKDAFEYTIFTRVASALEEPEAFVVARDVAITAAVDGKAA